MSTGNIIKLNVGGAHFQTSKSTLTRFDGFFKTMLETEIPITKDEFGAIFIDRDSTHFHRILNYMRDGEIELAESTIELKNLQKEAQYYLLEGLVELCDTELDKKFEASILNVQGVRVCDYKKPILTLRYPLNTVGQAMFPMGFNIRRFVERYKHKLDFKFENVHGFQCVEEEEPTSWQWRISWGHEAKPSKGATGYIYDVTMSDPFLPELEEYIQEFFEKYRLTL